MLEKKIKTIYRPYKIVPISFLLGARVGIEKTNKVQLLDLLSAYKRRKRKVS